MSVHRIMEACLRDAGRDIPIDPFDLVTEALTLSDFPKSFMDAQNKLLLQGYKSYPENWKLIARVRPPAKDFKTNYGVRVGSVGSLKEIPGDMKKGIEFTSRSEEGIEYVVKPYARGLEIGIKELVNDDLGAFSDNAQELSRVAAESLSESVFGMIDDNETFTGDSKALFHADHNNTAAGALTMANLKTALTALRNDVAVRTDADGNTKKIFFRKVYLVVPPALELDAKEIYKTIQMSASYVTGSTVPAFAEVGLQPPIVCQELTANDAYWYLIADPADLPCLEVKLLQGMEIPKLLSSLGYYRETMFGYNFSRNFTIEQSILHCWGRAINNYRGILRRTG